MVQDHWFVGFRSQFVTCTAYTWSQRDGYHTRGLGRLTEYAFSYLGIRECGQDPYALDMTIV